MPFTATVYNTYKDLGVPGKPTGVVVLPVNAGTGVVTGTSGAVSIYGTLGDIKYNGKDLTTDTTYQFELLDADGFPYHTKASIGDDGSLYEHLDPRKILFGDYSGRWIWDNSQNISANDLEAILFIENP